MVQLGVYSTWLTTETSEAIRTKWKPTEKKGSITSFAYFRLLEVFIRSAHVHSIVERPLRWTLGMSACVLKESDAEEAEFVFDTRSACGGNRNTHSHTHTQMQAHSYPVPIVWLAGSQTPTYINWLHNLFDSMAKAEFIKNPQRVCPRSYVCVAAPRPTSPLIPELSNTFPATLNSLYSTW